MKNFLFSLDNISSDYLDQISEQLGCSRSAAVRISIRFYQNMNQIHFSSTLGELYNDLPDLPCMEDYSDD